MIREAIANYLNARAELIRSKKPCEHHYELICEVDAAYGFNPNFHWKEYTYFCDKCGSSKVVSTRGEEG